MTPLIAFVAVVLATTVTGTVASAPAHAKDVRIVDRSSSAMPTLASDEDFKSGDMVTVPGTISPPTDVELQAGETIKVVYADGELTHQADSTGCVRTYGAHNISSGRPLTAMHSLGNGAGCSSSVGTTGYLWAYDGTFWGDRLKDSTYSGLVPVGSTRYFYTEYLCEATYTTTWKNRTGSPTQAELVGSRTCY